MQRAIVLLLVVALAAAVTGGLWARSGQAKPQMAAQMAPKMSAMAEFDRCTKTCRTLMDYYHKTYAKTKAHEGDKTCWSNCWTRFGQGKSASVSQTKDLWMSKMSANMRANQCAQACWRTQHGQQRTVTVAGWRSQPRPSTVCYR